MGRNWCTGRSIWIWGKTCLLWGLQSTAQRVVESLSLEIFKPCLNTILCNLLWVNLLEQGVGPDHLQRSLPTPSSPGSCKTQMQLQECAGAKSALPMTKCIASHNTLTYRAKRKLSFGTAFHVFETFYCISFSAKGYLNVDIEIEYTRTCAIHNLATEQLMAGDWLNKFHPEMNSQLRICQIIPTSTPSVGKILQSSNWGSYPQIMGCHPERLLLEKLSMQVLHFNYRENKKKQKVNFRMCQMQVS